MKKRLKTILLATTFMSISILAMPVIAAEQGESAGVYSEDCSIQPRTDIKEWKYAVINGNIYKRLYNYSTGHWETDWILVATGV